MDRRRALRFIHNTTHDVHQSRIIESMCHSISITRSEYMERVRHVAFNISQNKKLGVNAVHGSDSILTQGTVVGRIREQTRAREMRFSAMLQEKYDALNDATFEAIVRCRRCGNEDVTWEEKQTRSADEGATIYCSCPVCKNRWVMRQ